MLRIQYYPARASKKLFYRQGPVMKIGDKIVLRRRHSSLNGWSIKPDLDGEVVTIIEIEDRPNGGIITSCPNSPNEKLYVFQDAIGEVIPSIPEPGQSVCGHNDPDPMLCPLCAKETISESDSEFVEKAITRSLRIPLHIIIHESIAYGKTKSNKLGAL